MKVKMIKEFRISKGRAIKIRTILPVRYLPDNQFINSKRQYQVIDGEFSGCAIPKEFCIEVHDEKTYSEKEWNDLENHYMKLLDEERNKVSQLQKEKNDFIRLLVKHFELNSVSSQVNKMLGEWLDKSYETSEEEDQKNFSLELTKFIDQKLRN